MWARMGGIIFFWDVVLSADKRYWLLADATLSFL